MRIRQAAAKCNLSALRRGLSWRWKRAGLGPGLGVSLVKWRCTQGDCLIYRQQEIKKKSWEREGERGREWERGGNLNVISKKWIKNLCGGTKQPIEGWFIAQGRGGALGLPNWVATLGRFLSTHHNQRATERKSNGRRRKGWGRPLAGRVGWLDPQRGLAQCVGSRW